MLAGLRIGIGAVAIVAAVVAGVVLGGCGGGSGGATTNPSPQRSPVSQRSPTPRTVVGHRLGPERVEPGGQSLPARPCLTVGENRTTTVHVYSEAGPCVRVRPGERLLFVNDTGVGPQHAGATAVGVRIGDYALKLEPRQRGLIPAPVETYLGRGSHAVRTAGAPGATVLLLPPVCAVRPPAAPGEELCFR